MTFRIRCKTTVRGREYKTVIELSLQKFKLPKNCWVVEQWKMLEIASLIRPMSTNDLGPYKLVLKLLIGERRGREILGLPNNKVGRKEIIQLFRIAEHELLASSNTTQVKTRASSIFRKITIDSAKHQDLKEEISRETLAYKTQLNSRIGPRPLISEGRRPSLESELISPIAAISHRSIRELIEKAEDLLGDDLNNIQQACIKELTLCKSIRAQFQELEKHQYSEHDIQLGTELIKCPKRLPKHLAEFLDKNSPTFIIGLYLQLITIHRLALVNRKFSPTFWRIGGYLKSVLPDNCHHIASQGHRLLYLQQRIISNELIAAFVLLLIYTGWNGASLINMSEDTIQVNDNSIIIQGYKSKTDDHTPKIFLDSSHPYAIQAIKLLIWNKQKLIELGFLDESTKYFWYTWSLKYSVYRSQYIGFQNALKAFQECHSLPKFSLDQIRPQILAYQSLRTKNPEYVRIIAGHKSLETTGHYLDQLLFFRLNQAINLEFQRRLENTIKFRLSLEEEAFAYSVDNRFVDTKLLMPLGDGASCVDPWNPPDKSFMLGNICDGKRCHLGDGCDNRRVVINRGRLEEIIRKRRYYLRNWQRLEANNKHSFITFHIPAILFNFGLYDYINSGAYRHILRGLEEEIVRDEA